MHIIFKDIKYDTVFVPQLTHPPLWKIKYSNITNIVMIVSIILKTALIFMKNMVIGTVMFKGMLNSEISRIEPYSDSAALSDNISADFNWDRFAHSKTISLIIHPSICSEGLRIYALSCLCRDCFSFRIRK